MRSNARIGALAGLITGVVFGILLQLIAFRTPAGSRVFLMEVINATSGPASFVISWAFHLFDSIVMGAIFGAVIGKKIFSYKDGLKYGALCGLAWWVLGGIFLMPIFLGLSVFSPETLEPIQPVGFHSLIGHILFGLIYGGVFVALQAKSKKAEIRDLHQEQRDSTRFKAG
jgi:hypothetical protein